MISPMAGSPGGHEGRAEGEGPGEALERQTLPRAPDGGSSGAVPPDRSGDVVIPALLRSARQSYGGAIRDALVEVGCGDVPQNGAYVIGAIANSGSPLSRIIEGLGVSKQTAGQLVDTLVVRGYLGRTPDPDDRRRLTVSLTERGHLAAQTIRAAIEDMDARLEDRVGPVAVAHARQVLWALQQMADESAAARDEREG